jgi:DNA invertase Pin-like site-specific DNA recombinase
VRVSTTEQNLARQLDGLALDKVFTDKCSGKDTNRPGLRAMLDYVREGDTIYVHSMDRLARSLSDLLALVERLEAKGVTLVVVKDGLTFAGHSSPTDKLLLAMLGAVAEFERAMIRERQAEGIALAKAEGKYKGRKPVVDKDKLKAIRKLVANKIPKAVIARDQGISRATLYAYLNQPE